MSFSVAVLRNARSPAEAGSVTPIRTLSRVLFSPRSLVRFARDHPSIEGHGQLVALLDREGLGEAWYAILCVDQMNTGERRENLNYVRIGQASYRFATIRADLNKLAAWPAVDPALESEASRVVIIPEELARFNPQDVPPNLVERDRSR